MSKIFEKEIEGNVQVTPKKVEKGHVEHNLVDDGYVRWEQGGRITRNSVDVMCGIGIFIFGWLLAGAYSSAGRGRQGWGIIIGVIFLSVIGSNIGGPLAFAGIALYIGGWLYLRTKVGEYEKRFQSETMQKLADSKNAIEYYPEEPKGYYQMTEALKDLNRKEEAAEALQQGLRLDYNNAGKQNELGIMLMSLNRYDEALLCFEEAIRHASKEDENIPAHYRNQARALKKLGRKEEAKQAKYMAKKVRKLL